ncbi:hypothetical protein RNJ44_04800 [Nakaseomyces bracarensis]|uniref:Uncharacterized protein n=1 Tax=Nakaseomyces bracarensis TaxID=273131 RepID=A0ABR4NVX2_9SACH
MAENNSWLLGLLPDGEYTKFENDKKFEVEIENVHIICSIDYLKNKFGCTIINIDDRKISSLSADIDVSKSEHISYGSNSKVSSIASLTNVISILELLIMEYEIDTILYTTRISEEVDILVNSVNNNYEVNACLISQKYHKREENILSTINCRLNNNAFNSYFSTKMFDNTLSVGAFLSIISWYEKKANSTLVRNGFDRSFEIFEYINLRNRMQMDSSSYSALHIFKDSSLRLEQKFNNTAILTIEELFSGVKTTLGKKILKHWLLCPTTDISILNIRYDIIRVFSEVKYQEVARDIKKNMKIIPDILVLFSNLNRNILNNSNWRSLICFIDSCMKCLPFLDILVSGETNGVYLKLIDNIDFSFLRELYCTLEHNLELSSLLVDGVIEIKEGIYEEYDKCQQLYQRLENTLVDSVSQVIQKLSYVSSPNLDALELQNLVNAIYIPELGFLLIIDKELEKIVQEEELLEDWQLVFKNAEEIFYKTQDLIELDHIYGGIFAHITSLKVGVLQTIKENLNFHISNLIAIANCFAELEVLTVFADVSMSRNYCRPEVNDISSLIRLKSSRHPLQETLRSEFIENDIFIDGGSFGNNDWYKDGYQRIAVLTGPNGSGKTVFLEQIALTIYLAQIGCYVPAKSAQIGIVDKILTKLHTKDSINSMHSTFETDSIRVSSIFSMCTERSLVLIDEYGVGTDVISGPALLGSILESNSKNNFCPRIMLSTHFSELFIGKDLLSNIAGVKYLNSKVLFSRMQESPSRSNEVMNVTFLYKINEGLCTDSLGIYCARICGLDKTIIMKAEEIQNRFIQGDDIQACISSLSNEQEELFDQYQLILKHFLAWDVQYEENSSKENLKTIISKILSTTTNTIF